MKDRQKGKLHFLTGFGIVNLFCLMLLISAMTFAVGLPLSWWQFPSAICAAIGLNYFATHYYFGTNFRREFFLTSAMIVGVLMLCLFASAGTYDVSWDGQTYHQETLIQLKGGWNPFHSTLPTTAFRASELNHYGKGAEIPEADIYAFLNKIQEAKAANILLMCASFFLCTALLRSHTGLSTARAYLLGALFALNPVAIDQMLTYYVDGQTASLLCCLLAAGCLLFFELDVCLLVLFGAIVVIGVNVKPTMIGFSGIFTIGLLGALLLARKIKSARVVFGAVIVSFTTGICLTGFNPYITNTLQHGNPFYPLVGSNKVDIMTFNSPKDFLGMNRVDTLLISVCSHTDDINSQASRTEKLKYPFMFTRGDIRNSTMPDTRIGGFGFLFEEVMLFAVGLFISIIWLHWARAGKYVTYIIAVLIFSVLLLSEAWWARYVPQLWLVPVVVLVAGEMCQSAPIRCLRIVLYALLIINCGTILTLCIKNNVLAAAAINYQLARFKTASTPVRVNFGPFATMSVRFKEFHINYLEDAAISPTNAMVIEESFGLAAAEADNMATNVPRPFLLRLMSRLKHPF